MVSTRLSSSITRSMAVASGVLPRMAATCASVLPVSGFSASLLKPEKSTFSAPPAPLLEAALLHPRRHRGVEAGGARRVGVHVGGDAQAGGARRFDLGDDVG